MEGQAERVAVVRLLDGSVYDATAVRVDGGMVVATARKRRGGGPGPETSYLWGPQVVKDVRWDVPDAPDAPAAA